MKTTHKDFLKKLGLEIKVARIRKEMSTKQVSELTGLHHVTINEIEGGRTNGNILNYKRIADALEIDMKEFFVN